MTAAAEVRRTKGGHDGTKEVRPPIHRRAEGRGHPPGPGRRDSGGGGEGGGDLGVDGGPVGAGGEGRGQGGPEAWAASWFQVGPPKRCQGAGRRVLQIASSLDGDTVILRIPLGRIARRVAARKVLAEIERELER